MIHQYIEDLNEEFWAMLWEFDDVLDWEKEFIKYYNLISETEEISSYSHELFKEILF